MNDSGVQLRAKEVFMDAAPYPLSHNSVYQTSRWMPIRRILLLIAGTVVACGALILWHSGEIPFDFLTDWSPAIGESVILLMPYMISAVIAAITAIAVMALWPSVRKVSPSKQVIDRLRDLGAGDLASPIKVRGDDQIREIASELSGAVSALSVQVDALKVINRAQWGCLCQIRAEAERQNCQTVLLGVAEMEKNWEKLAAIENRLLTT